MILAKSIAEARAQRTHLIHADGRESWVSRFFTASADTPDQPVAFLVEKQAEHFDHPLGPVAGFFKKFPDGILIIVGVDVFPGGITVLFEFLGERAKRVLPKLGGGFSLFMGGHFIAEQAGVSIDVRTTALGFTLYDQPPY